MLAKNFSYQAQLQLSHENFKKHSLRQLCSGVGALLESEGFTEYKACAEALNDLAHDLIDTLTEQNDNKKFIIAWETNPTDGKGTHITPAEYWAKGEIVKFYVIEQTAEPITSSNLNPMLAASILASESSKEFYN